MPPETGTLRLEFTNTHLYLLCFCNLPLCGNRRVSYRETFGEHPAFSWGGVMKCANSVGLSFKGDTLRRPKTGTMITLMIFGKQGPPEQYITGEKKNAC